MVLVDTSNWIEALRAHGDPAVRDRIQRLVLAGTAAWCEMVRIELWRGIKGDREKKDLVRLEPLIHTFTTDIQAWEIAVDLTRRAQIAGLNVPAADLVIAATAVRYKVPLDHTDKHLARLIEIA